jgi:hypothetical protein
LKIAQERAKRIIPVILDNTDLPSELKDKKYIDLRENKDEGIKELIRAVS